MQLKNNGKVRSVTVGSLPKPTSIYPKSGRELLDGMGYDFRAQFSSAHQSHSTLDKAVDEALAYQAEAGLDIVTDGEERRGHYVLDVLAGLNGIDMSKRKPTAIRGGTVTRELPVVSSAVSYSGPTCVTEEFLYAKNHAKGMLKVGLPGPMTVADCVNNEYYNGDKRQLAFAYASAIRSEVSTLVAAGCSIIQFDDPVLLRYPAEAKKWGLLALQECFKGFENQATFVVHICCGYPDKPLETKGVDYKANAGYYRYVLSWLADSTLDIISIEGAQSNIDVSVLDAAGNKAIMLGVLDVGDEHVETVNELVVRGKEALQYIPKDQLILAPDCGMLELSLSATKQKLQNLAAAVDSINIK